MKALVKVSAASPEFAFMERPIPTIDADELLVRIHAIGVGVHDEYFLPPTASYPYVIGIEAAGVIEKVGGGVTGHQPGERIAFVSAMQHKGGTWAEYAVVAANSLIVRLPDDLSFERAAAVPVAGNTALKAFHTLKLQPGDPVFVAGGAGAIGTFAIQLAASHGYAVSASASKKNHDYLRELGATKTVDYRDNDWQAQVRAWYPDGVRAAIAVQPNTSASCEPIVADGGTIVAISGDQFKPARGIQLAQIPYTVDVTEELSVLMQRIAAGEATLTIDKVYPFAEAEAALAQVRLRHTRGKLVLKVI